LSRHCKGTNYIIVLKVDVVAAGHALGPGLNTPSTTSVSCRRLQSRGVAGRAASVPR
jgi:hypothetical protein